jgi:RNA polymerase sigma-70 factor, ECF subfamily
MVLASELIPHTGFFDETDRVVTRLGRVTGSRDEAKYQESASKEAVTPNEQAQASRLMLRAQGGDEGAYAELLVLLATAARRYTRARLRAPVPWIDDVVQDTLLAVHHARSTFDGRRPFAPWFYAIARNRFVDVLRREQRVGEREIVVERWPEIPDGSRDDVAPIDVDAVRRALDSLPPRQRDIVESLKLRDETVRDIAGRLGMTIAAVKVTAHRGYRTLRRLLGVDLREE